MSVLYLGENYFFITFVPFLNFEDIEFGIKLNESYWIVPGTLSFDFDQPDYREMF